MDKKGNHNLTKVLLPKGVISTFYGRFIGNAESKTQTDHEVFVVVNFSLSRESVLDSVNTRLHKKILARLSKGLLKEILKSSERIRQLILISRKGFESPTGYRE